jgi:hypothetical protein
VPRSLLPESRLVAPAASLHRRRDLADLRGDRLRHQILLGRHHRPDQPRPGRRRLPARRDRRGRTGHRPGRLARRPRADGHRRPLRARPAPGAVTDRRRSPTTAPASAAASTPRCSAARIRCSGTSAPGSAHPRPTASSNGSSAPWKYEHLYRADIGDALAVEVHRFRHLYNTIRPHQALADRTPAQVYTPLGGGPGLVSA